MLKTRFATPSGGVYTLHAATMATRRILQAGLPMEAVALMGIVWGARAEVGYEEWSGVHRRHAAASLGLTEARVAELAEALEALQLLRMDEEGLCWVRHLHEGFEEEQTREFHGLETKEWCA